MTAAKPVDVLVEDLLFLAEHQVGITEAARRTGFASADALDRWLRRHDQAALAVRLVHLDPIPLVTSKKAS